MFNPKILNVKSEDTNNNSTVNIKFEDTMQDATHPNTDPNLNPDPNMQYNSNNNQPNSIQNVRVTPLPNNNIQTQSILPNKPQLIIEDYLIDDSILNTNVEQV